MSTKNSKNFKVIYYEFLKNYRNEVKEQSFKSYKYNFESHILPYFKDKDLDLICKKDFLEWKNLIYQSQFKNSFNQKLYVCFNRFLKYCIDLDLVEINYLKELGPFKRKAELKNNNYYSIQEFKRFIKGFDKEDEVYKQFFILLFFSGLRPSEAMALKFSDIKGNTLSINKSIQRRGKRKIETPKNQSSIRAIQIDKKTLNGILKLKKMYKYFNDNYFIFGGAKPLSSTTIDRKKRKACSKVGIREITQHQFRHSHASLLINEGIPITEVSKRLGHSNITTTLNVYSHTNFEQEKRVLKKLNFLHFN